MERFNYPDNWPEDWPTNENGQCSLCKDSVSDGMVNHMTKSHPKKLAGFEFFSNDGEFFKFDENGKKILESKFIYGENFIREKRLFDFLKAESEKSNAHSFILEDIIQSIKDNKHLDVLSSSDQSTIKEEKKKDFEGKYLRSIAELENYRKRTQKDKDNWTQQAVRSFSKDLVGAVENLELAIKTTEDKIDDDNYYAGPSKGKDYDDALLTGVKAIRDQLSNMLKQRKVEKIKVNKGDEFDPDLHNVLLMQEDPNVKGQVIGMILRPGYMIKDQVLIPAQVQVLKGIKS